MSTETKVQVIFTQETPYGVFRDALYFEPTEYEKLDDKQINLLAQERIDKYIEAVENPIPLPEPTKDELLALLTEYENQKAAIEDSQADLQAKIDALPKEIDTALESDTPTGVFAFFSRMLKSIIGG